MIGDGSSQKRRREGFEFLFGGNGRSQKKNRIEVFPIFFQLLVWLATRIKLLGSSPS